MLRYIQKGKDTSKLKEDLKITIILKNQNELWLNNFRIRNGNENDIKNIEDIINDIPSNKLILKGLSDIHQKLLKIEKESDKTREELGQIITNIEKDNYKTLTACCPTQNGTIWNYQK